MKDITVSQLLTKLRNYSTFIGIAVIMFLLLQNGCDKSNKEHDIDTIDLLISTQEDRAILLENENKRMKTAYDNLKQSKIDTLQYYENILDTIKYMSTSGHHNGILSIIE